MLPAVEDITGRHVIVVEDILDSGNTLSYLLNILEHRHPASVRLCARPAPGGSG